MKKKLLTLSLLISSLAPFTAANAADPVTGYWLTENKRAVINLADCDQNLCGTVYWIIEGGM